jgi:uroporphyrinogen-III decarboxylase
MLLRPQVVQLFDSWAHHLSPAQFAEFSLPYAEQIIRDVHVKYPDTPLIFHANGGTDQPWHMTAAFPQMLSREQHVCCAA